MHVLSFFYIEPKTPKSVEFNFLESSFKTIKEYGEENSSNLIEAENDQNSFDEESIKLNIKKQPGKGKKTVNLK